MNHLLVFALALSTGACGASRKRTADLVYDIRTYNEGIRWNKLPQAAVHILPQKREAFLDEREELEEELRIDDFELQRVKMSDDKQESALIQIRWTWHMDSEGIVKTTTTRQKWRRFGSRWLMVAEHHVRGDEMPGVKSEEELPDSELDAGLDAVSLSPKTQ